MSFPSLIRLLPGILAPLLACSAARAQIHVDDKPLPGLEEGLLFHNAMSLETRVRKEPQQLAGPQSADIASQDFSICFWVPADAPAHTQSLARCSLSKTSDKAGWAVSIGDDITVMLRSQAREDPITMRTPSGEKGEGLHHIAIVIKREARQPLSGIWIDGVEQVSIAVPPVSFSSAASPLMLGESDGVHSIHDLRIYDRALTRSEILDLMWLPKGDKPAPKHPAPPPNGPRFIPQQDETIALIGGTEAVALAESGELEALLLMAFPNTRFHFRSLAWEGDTVFKQDRPMNFGSLEQQLRRVNAGAVFVMFGRQECLDRGKDGLAEFKTAFGKLLDTVEKVTPNIVVIGPPGFEKKDAPLPSFDSQNIAFASYLAALEEAAKQRGFTFVNANKGFQTMIEYLNRNRDNADWLNSWKISGETPEPTSDGVTLTKSGAWRMGECIAREELGVPRADTRGSLALPYGIRGVVLPIQSKNRLWHNYWRPSNWAFLHGDRTNQPSSRDPVNPQIRFFPAEQEKYLPLIKEAEDKVFQLVQEAQKKLP